MFERASDIRAAQRAKIRELAQRDRRRRFAKLINKAYKRFGVIMPSGIIALPYSAEVEKFLSGDSDKPQNRLWGRVTETADDIWFYVRAFFA